jgi:23S rRNA (pseudouridine1915-N3)-methyltransferase
MQILFISVGKKHDQLFAAGIEEYTRRIARFTDVRWLLLPDSGIGPAGMKRESTAIAEKISADDIVVVLDETGNQLTSQDLSNYVMNQTHKTGRLVFIIGGAYGTSPELRAAASLVWSLGPLTLPHQIVRLILAEQVYRAYAIARNLPYHHA